MTPLFSACSPHIECIELWLPVCSALYIIQWTAIHLHIYTSTHMHTCTHTQTHTCMHAHKAHAGDEHGNDRVFDFENIPTGEMGRGGRVEIKNCTMTLTPARSQKYCVGSELWSVRLNSSHVNIKILIISPLTTFLKVKGKTRTQ